MSILYAEEVPYEGKSRFPNRRSGGGPAGPKGRKTTTRKPRGKK